jgi:hypothetical protein
LLESSPLRQRAATRPKRARSRASPSCRNASHSPRDSCHVRVAELAELILVYAEFAELLVKDSETIRLRTSADRSAKRTSISKRASITRLRGKLDGFVIGARFDMHAAGDAGRRSPHIAVSNRLPCGARRAARGKHAPRPPCPPW